MRSEQGHRQGHSPEMGLAQGGRQTGTPRAQAGKLAGAGTQSRGAKKVR